MSFYSEKHKNYQYIYMCVYVCTYVCTCMYVCAYIFFRSYNYIKKTLTELKGKIYSNTKIV